MHVYPHFGDVLVDVVTTDHVAAALMPIWRVRPETAVQVRGRIEQVLDWARARGYRSGDNPARWRGHLSHLFPRLPGRVEHHPAIAYDELPGFMAELRARDGVAARALEFLIYTAARTGEVLAARWDEIDLGSCVWTLPASRTKAGREHRVPLSAAAVALLRDLPRVSEWVFPGLRGHLSQRALRLVLSAMRRSDITPHGMRSAFRDWAGNETAYPRELAEAALGHVVGDKAEQAYRRSDAIERRRELMQRWADYCTATANVLPLRAVS
jgi:integrase